MSSVTPWPADLTGVVTLPSGLKVRGRSWRKPADVRPDFGVYLVHGPWPAPQWAATFVPWPDYGLPSDKGQLRKVLTEVLSRAERERIELCCAGGRGRTGTALACLAILDGVPSVDAVAWVRENFRPDAVETPTQEWFVKRFDNRGGI